MAKIIALDIGSKRTGIAETDPLQLIASPRETISTSSLTDYLRSLFVQEEYSTIVIGDPKNLKGEDSDNSQLVRDITARLQKHFPEMKLVMQDERFSSRLAVRGMVDSGMKKKKRRNKSEIDKISAAIILRDFLNG